MKSPHVARLEHRVSSTAARLVAHATANRIPVADLPQVRLPWYEIRNQAGAGAAREDAPTVFIFDEIGGSLGVSAKQFVAELEEIDAPVIRVRINSPGGSVFDAITIHSALLHHPAKIQVYIDGLAASAASVIAMGGDEVIMMPGSQMMIHDASMVEDGNAADHAKTSTFLDRQSENVAGMYQRRGGGDIAEWREHMIAETWMFADEAVKMGLADRTEIPRVVEEQMTRGFDLAGRYRYAGRREAPAPSRHSAGQRTRREPARPPRIEVTETREEQLRAAGQRRAEAAMRGVACSVPPNGQARTVSTAWMQRRSDRPTPGVLTLPPRLTTKLTERDGKQFYVVEGYYTAYERGYDMWDEHGPYEEIVSARAGEKTTAANPDVIFLTNHRGLAMARTTAGTLELWSDDIGGGDRAWLNPQRQDVKDLVLGIEDGTITEQSFAFLIESGRWNRDFTQYRIDIYNIDRGDTSAVNYGANPHTSIAARAREILEELEHLPAGAARAALDRLHHRSDLETARSAVLVVPEKVIPEEPNPELGGRSMTQLEAWLATVAAGK